MFRKTVTKTSFLLTTCLVVIALWADPALGASPPEADGSPRARDGYDSDPGRGQALTISGVFAPANVAVMAETISAGWAHTCGLRTDGTVACWGYNGSGRSTPPGTTFTQVSAGVSHNCGLQTDGTLACWGLNDYGQASPSGSTFTQVSAGYHHTCGVRTDGTLACWGAGTPGSSGYPHFGQASPPGDTFTQVSAGGHHTCGVKTDGTLACWGRNDDGQATPPGSTFTQVSAGGFHTCGLRTDGTLACWGYNGLGQATPPGGTFTQVSAGYQHTCGVKTDGTLACWGRNDDGQATPPGGIFSQISAGVWHTCGVKTDGTPACWGWNEYGQANPPGGTFSQRRVSAGGAHTCGLQTDGTPACWGRDDDGQATPPSGAFTQVSVGLEHTCGLRTDGTLACWGRNDDGQANPPGSTFSRVSAGGHHSCGVRTDGTAACCGDNSYGQAVPPGWPPPVDVFFTQVSAGDWHTCGVKTDGTVACWGRNDDGQSTPPSGTFTQVSAGGFHTCGLKTDGTLACWGRNSAGQATPPGGTFTQASAGGDHTCGLRTDGTLGCWGRNDDGQAAPPSGAFTQVSAGWAHTCGVKTDGTLTCWGWNGYGQAPRITVNPASLPDGQGGVSYSQSLSASGGTAPYTFALAAASLPPGLGLSAEGVLSGTPTSDGVYTFTVQATDIYFFGGERAYTLTVPNQAPTGISLAPDNVAENLPVSTTVGTLTTTDPDTLDTHTYSLVDTGTYPDNDSFSIAGSQLQTAAVMNYETQNSYTITVRTDDGSGGTYDEIFAIHVVDANDSPTASDDTYSVGEDALLGVAAPGVLDNDSDEDDHPLTAVLDSGPGHGTLTLNGDGSFVYAPPLGYRGVVTFTYHAHDGAANSNTATVSVTVGFVNEVYLPLVLRGQPQAPGADPVKGGKPAGPYPAHQDADASPDPPLLEGVLQRAGMAWPPSATICPLPRSTRATRPRQLRRSTFAQPPAYPALGRWFDGGRCCVLVVGCGTGG